MALDVGKIRAGVEADLRDFDQGLKGLIDSLGKLEAHAKGVPPPLNRTAREMTDAGRSAKQAAEDVRQLDVSLASVQRSARATGGSFVDAEKKAIPLRRQLTSVAQGMSTVAGAAGSATGRIGTFGASMLSVFATGGPIALGIGALAGGVGIVASRLREAAREARQLDALHDILGVTSGEVDTLRRRFSALGADINQHVAVQIMRAGREAGISTREIAGMADEIAKLGHLLGGDFSGAAGQIFARHAEKAREAATAYDAIHDAISGVRGDTDAVLRAEQRRLDVAYEQLAQLEQQAEQQRILVENERHRAALFGEWERHAAAAAQQAETQRQIEALQQEIALREDLLVRYELERDAERERQENARRREESARLAAARQEADLAMAARVRQMEAQLADDRKAELRAVAEEEIRIQRRAVEARTLSEESFASWRAAREAQLARDIQAIDDELAASQRQREFEIRTMVAKGREDRLAEARIAAEREIAEEEAKVDGIQYTWDQFYAWRVAREAQLQAELRQIAQREEAEAKRQAEQARAELDRQMKDRERNISAGFAAGRQFATGMRRALESGETGEIFAAFLGLAGTIGSIATGSVIPGAAAGFLGSFFHDGGMVGSEGHKVPIPRYHDGGMLVAHRGMMIPEPGPGEVPIMGQVGEAVLSRVGVAAAGGPSAIRALNNGEAPAAGSSVNVTINAPGGFLHREYLRSEVAALLQDLAVRQDSVFMRTLSETRRVARR